MLRGETGLEGIVPERFTTPSAALLWPPALPSLVGKEVRAGPAGLPPLCVALETECVQLQLRLDWPWRVVLSAGGAAGPGAQGLPPLAGFRGDGRGLHRASG